MDVFGNRGGLLLSAACLSVAATPRTFCPVQTLETEDSYELRMVAGGDGRVRLRVGLKPESGDKSSGDKSSGDNTQPD